MSPVVFLVLLIPALAALGIVFALNVLRGYKTGIIWSRSVRVNRASHPINFHITALSYLIATLVCSGGIGAIVFALATSV